MADGPSGRVAPYARGVAAVALVAAATGIAGCGNEHVYGVSARTTTSPAAPTMAQVRADLKRMGFDLYGPKRMPHGPLRAFRGIWHAAGDGGVQNVFFYAGRRFVGVAHDPNFRSVVIAAENGQSVTVKQYRYRTNDPNCCPTGGTRDYVFTWSAGHLLTRTTGPAHPAPTAPPASPNPV